VASNQKENENMFTKKNSTVEVAMEDQTGFVAMTDEQLAKTEGGVGAAEIALVKTAFDAGYQAGEGLDQALDISGPLADTICEWTGCNQPPEPESPEPEPQPELPPLEPQPEPCIRPEPDPATDEYFIQGFGGGTIYNK
jgi:hypothetical protein